MCAQVLCTLVISEHCAVVKCMWYYVKAAILQIKKNNDITHKMQKVKTVYIKSQNIWTKCRLLHAGQWGVLVRTTLR